MPHHCFRLLLPLLFWFPFAQAAEVPESFIQLQPGAVYEGQLGEHEVVRFYFVLDSKADVQVESRTTANRTNNVYPQAVLFHPDGRVIARDWNGGEGRNFRINRQLEAGTYVLRVEDGRGCGSLHGCPEINRSYSIQLDVTEASIF